MTVICVSAQPRVVPSPKSAVMDSSEVLPVGQALGHK